MSNLKSRVLDAYMAFDNTDYQPVKTQMLNKHIEELKLDITPESILSNLKEAYSKGFIGYHFIDGEYLGVVGQFLENVFGTDKHYLKYHHVCKHGKLCLVVDTAALNVSHQKLWSFESNNNKYADTCYEPQNV
jgi:hypothetical protein